MITNKSKNFFRVSTDDFKKIPGSPIAYWATENVRNLYTSNAISFLKYLDPWCGEFRRLAVPSFRTTAGKSVSQSIESADEHPVFPFPCTERTTTK